MIKLIEKSLIQHPLLKTTIIVTRRCKFIIKKVLLYKETHINY